MIIELKVKNFRSIRDQQTLSLVASPASELEENTFFTGKSTHLHLVRAAVIYGANAGGKSNLLTALLFMRWFILSSARESQQGEKIPVESFLFDGVSSKRPSEFEATFIKNNIRYQYGFVLNENRIHEEWLFAYPTTRGQQWFSRVYDKKTEKYSWKFSKFFKGNKQVVDLTRDNVLFLSNAVKLNNEQLVPIFDWFQKDLVLIDSLNGRGLGYKKSINHIKTDEGKKRILKFMNAADPSIADVILDSEKMTEANAPSFPATMPKEVQDFFKKEILNSDKMKINFTHGNTSLDMSDESDGTRKLLAFAGPWLDALNEGHVLIVDEINSSLHPLVVKFLIKLIYDPKINKKNAQLIFTAHDTSLLGNELFRRDQIWFVEKDKNNSTQLYPLLDFSPRKHEAFNRGYLQGRYGALPYIRELYDVVLIVCEDKKTEPNYLKELCNEYQLNSANIKVLGIGADPLSIVNYALKEFDLHRDYDRIYCVFDKDQHASYQAALNKIESCQNRKSNKIPIYAITSVPCFEYWLLLHFVESTKPYTKIGNKSAGNQMLAKLKEHIPKYTKDSQNIYEMTKDKINHAIERAKKINAQQEINGTDNPTTMFYQLVEYLKNIKNE